MCHKIILILEPKIPFVSSRLTLYLTILEPKFHFSLFFTLKSIYFLALCKIPDRWICHTTKLILGPIFRFWALKAYFRLFDPQK
jgi:hypothetical protein